MWFLLIYIQLTAIQAQDRIALRGSSHPCEGRLEVYYKNQWGRVGHHQWRDENGAVVCKSLGCGDHVESMILQEASSSSFTNCWLDEIKCKGTENKLWDCESSSWNATQCHPHTYVSVRCSGNISLTLNLHGMTDECAGVVQFTTPNGTISVCQQNWDENEANKVCQKLKCGKYEKTFKLTTVNAKGNSYSVPLNCIGKEEFLWQCVDSLSAKSHTCQEEIGIICSNYSHVRLHGGADACEGTLEEKDSTEGGWANVPCQEGDYNRLDKMCAKLKCGRAVSVKPCNESKNTWLKCSDRVKVQLGKSGEKPPACYGDIYVSVNGSQHAVCIDATSSNVNVGEVVCQELQCGTPLSVLQSSKLQQDQISQVECHGQEKSLWECLHKRGTVGSCRTINIICSGSLDMHLSNGLDECTGQLEVKSSGSWWSVSSVDWSKENSDMVCQYLQCGEKMKENNQHHFVKSKLQILQWTLKCTGSNISQCRMAKKRYDQQDKVVNIICNKHELWFLQGNSTCEGRVKGETDVYLQNITNGKAAEVCARNLCGSVQKIDNSNMQSSVCPENATSSSSCSMKNTTTSTEPQFDYVKCSDVVKFPSSVSGSMKVWLQNKCYGKVLVCPKENCGVCEDTWTEKQSRMLCKSLGCGELIREKYSEKKKSGVTVASVHCSQTAENFGQCNFVKLEDTSLCQNPAYVVCTGSVKAVLQDPRDKCAGNLKLFYSGELRPLCTNSINEKTQNAICTNLGCGEALSFNEPLSKMSNSKGLTSVTCQNATLSSCDFSKTKVKQCQAGYLKCTGWRRLLLTNIQNACTGEVYLQKERDFYAVSSDGWSKQEGNELCKYLECGNVSETTNKEQVNVSFWSKSYSCTGNPKSIWDCEKEKAPVKNHHLHISCTDKPEVKLKGNCTGEVQLKKMPVCYKSQETARVFSEFCHDLNCSMFFKSWSTNYSGNAHYLSCTGKESKLWQCSSWTDNCEGVVSLACTKAIKLNFSSPCGGELQVDYRGKWEPVCPLASNQDANRICRELKCGDVSRTNDEAVENTANTDISINCGDDYKSLMHCVKPVPQACTRKAVFYCDNYIPPVKKIQPDTGLIVGVVVGLVLVLVAVLIVFWKRKTFLAILRFKTSAEDTDMEISGKEMQRLSEKDVFEEDDYDDIVTTVNPMEDNQSQVSASEHDEENKSTSEGSSGTEYDDVDEENVKPPAESSTTDPLLPPRPDNLLDEVTFEAEVEPQEDYDDVSLPQAMVSEQRESFDIPGPSSDPPLLVSNDEAKPQKDE
ncbi:hypothetical protein PHYPO_G00230190 [Pangasianodon hypophthalmus]|uniref:SRCR domain-containing protein n=1 Tax=Pangasianodon hypophthalmus TaxID=310915 RepID=A0A5N5NKV9_PANHP|nr:hypothetical protein PHYPO_G00230190 [Pangasianodon hypophthalmus]